MSDDVRYIVRRFNWRFLQQTADGSWYVRLPGATLVAAFDSPDDAETYRWEREQAIRRRVNPFRCGTDLTDLTHLPAYAFKDYLLDDDVRPAKGDSFAQVRWDKWWDRNACLWNEDRRQRVWDVLDRVRFFEVSEQPIGVLNVAVEPVFPNSLGFGDRPRRSEGGRPRRGFGSREDAVAYCELLDDDIRATTRDLDYNRAFRVSPAGDPFELEEPALDPHDERWCFVYPVPCEGNPRGRAFVVCRVALSVTPITEPRAPMGFLAGVQFDASTRWLAMDDWGNEDYIPFGSLDERRIDQFRFVPGVAFADAEAARAARAECERVGRRWLNPYLIRPPRYVPGFYASDELLELAADFPRSRVARPMWWMATFAQAPQHLFDAAWEAFDIPPLYQVVEIEVED
jgi:hypothetical protein